MSVNMENPTLAQDIYNNFFQIHSSHTLLVKQFSDYMLDFNQRCILFLDVMRQRGNQFVEMTDNDKSTVLNFEYEILLDGTTFNRPINYWLARVIAPQGVITDNKKRPFVVQDPRAGQSPGIGGMKKDSEIGDALRGGHPVYFIGFNSTPIEGQTYEDIIKGQLNFYIKIAELHKDSPKICAIGNCAAGYLTMFGAMQRPDLFGPILIAGSPLSYWNGIRGKNPMRYAGGLVGGSWIVSLLGDANGGKFDGSYLIENFNSLNPANTLWSKQYNLFANIDTESERYLQFEKWWGDFIQFNTAEIKWLVSRLFVGNELVTGNLATEDGIRLDPRSITSPILTFVSDGDNISPPAQSAGWIADLYHDAEEIRQHGKTIVYCLNHKVGHLAIFTASRVGKREDELFVESIDTVDVMSPGLYELVIDTPEGQENSGELRSHYEPRTIEDIRALGCNNVDDDRSFATMAKASAIFSQLYDVLLHPMFKLLDNSLTAEIAKNLRPLRLSYLMFADKINPWMQPFAAIASKVKTQRIQIDTSNSFLQLQQKFSDNIVQCLNHYSAQQSLDSEKKFFDIWGNTGVQKFWGTYKQEPHLTPSATQVDRTQVKEESAIRISDNIEVTSRIQALYRFIRLAIEWRGSKALPGLLISETLKEAKKLEPSWSDREIHEVIRNQAAVVEHDAKTATKALKKYFDRQKNGTKIVTIVKRISKRLSDTEGRRYRNALAFLTQTLGLVV